jgi:hypothetical protein
MGQQPVSNGLSATRMKIPRGCPEGRANRAAMFCLPNADAAWPCSKCRLPASAQSSLGNTDCANPASMGAPPSRIHCASWVNSSSILGAVTGAEPRAGGVC